MQSITQAVLKSLLKGELTNDSVYKSFYINSNHGPVVRLSNCIITEDVILDEIFNYTYNIYFSQTKFESNFRIETGSFRQLTFESTNLDSSKSFIIMNGSFQELSFREQSQFEGSFSIHGGEFYDIKLQSAEFSQGLGFVNGIFHEIYIGSCSFTKGLFFRLGEYKQIRIADATCSELHFSGGNYKSILVYGLTKISTIYLSSGTIDMIFFAAVNIAEIITKWDNANKRLEINKLIFEQMGKLTAFFANILIKIIEFKTAFLHKDSIIRFQNINSSKISFSNFVNYGQLTFSNLKLKDELMVKNSDLGKVAFINSIIKDIDLNLENSKITEAFFSDTTFPIRIASDDYQQRLAYAQLKKINEAKGDYLEANRFYALEMNSFYNTISWKKDFWEKLNLWFNKKSNNHGQSWSLGLESILLVSVIFYTIYLYFLDIRIGSINSKFDWKYFFTLLSYIFDFINPVHKTDEIAKNLNLTVTHPIARIIEGFSRIFIAYTIYQMVQAFRKHGKK